MHSKVEYRAHHRQVEVVVSQDPLLLDWEGSEHICDTFALYF